MEKPPENITWLDRATVASLVPSWTEQVDLLGRTYRAMSHGRVENPPKIGVHARQDTFIHAMPAHLRDDDVTALKWVSAYPSNPARDLPYISGLIVLNDSGSGLPVAIMDAVEITTARTAAASGVSIRHLAHPDWRRVAILGYGAQGRAHAEMVQDLNPRAEIRVYGGPRHPESNTAEDARQAVEDADVVITAGPMAPDPGRRVDPGWLKGQVLVLPVDFDAYVRADLAHLADDLVTDDVDQFEHHRTRGYFQGWPAPTRSLGAALDTQPTGDLRVSCSLGVGAVDAAMAAEIFRRAKERGQGVALSR